MFLALTRQFNYITKSAFYYTPITTPLGNQLIPQGARMAQRWELSPPTNVVGSGSSPGFDAIWELSSRRVSCTLTCDQVSFFPFCFGDEGKVHLLYASSARSPESGLLSDWSKKKRSLGALHRLVKQHVWLPELLHRFCHLRLFMTETTRWSRNS